MVVRLHEIFLSVQRIVQTCANVKVIGREETLEIESRSRGDSERVWQVQGTGHWFGRWRDYLTLHSDFQTKDAGPAKPKTGAGCSSCLQLSMEVTMAYTIIVLEKNGGQGVGVKPGPYDANYTP